MNKSQQYVIIVAGGSGSRMQSTLPKQFMLLAGKPILMHTIEAFHQYSATIKIILILPESHIETWQTLCETHQFQISIQIQAGGGNRFESVKKGLDLLENEGFVAIHDGVRPFINIDLINRAFLSAEINGNGVAAVALKESIRLSDGKKNKAVDRASYKIIQTPQVFQLPQIKRAYQNAANTAFTDDATVAENDGNEIFLVEGSYENIKVTTREDLYLAQALAEKRQTW